MTSICSAFLIRIQSSDLSIAQIVSSIYNRNTNSFNYIDFSFNIFSAKIPSPFRPSPYSHIRLCVSSNHPIEHKSVPNKSTRATRHICIISGLTKSQTYFRLRFATTFASISFRLSRPQN